ncbi:MAG: low-specificity L-threonine aldolase [Spirochaetota bacterium]|nr:MAG: low-specificity L-threonine aldolase [Spirochaetota bacterium]
MKIVDLRSDTLTMPSDAMREAMFKAELGDDVFGEDPTTNRLEEIAANKMGHEAALFVPSGTMGNLICVLTHCKRGEEVILGNLSHTFLYEGGGMSALGGVHPYTVANRSDGTMALEEIESAIRGNNVHYPKTSLICLENTHNRCSGAPLTVEYTDQVCVLAKRYSLSVHLDGARIFNAAVALGVDIKELVKEVDSLSFCFSKGLSAPVGSVICGKRSFVENARRIRKVLGGGMRQCGVLAAAGIFALEHMVDRLEEDHINASILAEGISKIPGLKIELSRLKTNIMYVDLESSKMGADEFGKKLSKMGIKVLTTGPKRFRMVTHYGIDEDDIEFTLQTLKEAVRDIMK